MAIAGTLIGGALAALPSIITAINDSKNGGRPDVRSQRDISGLAQALLRAQTPGQNLVSAGDAARRMPFLQQMLGVDPQVNELLGAYNTPQARGLRYGQQQQLRGQLLSRIFDSLDNIDPYKQMARDRGIQNFDRLYPQSVVGRNFGFPSEAPNGLAQALTLLMATPAVERLMGNIVSKTGSLFGKAQEGVGKALNWLKGNR